MNLVEIENKITDLSTESFPESVNDIILSINHIFKQSKLKTFPPKEARIKKKKPWYDTNLKKVKKKTFVLLENEKPRTNCSLHRNFTKS